MARSPEMMRFLRRSALALRASAQGRALRPPDRIIERFPVTGMPGGDPHRLPVCAWLEPALALAPPGQGWAGAGSQRWRPALARRSSASPADEDRSGRATPIR